MQLLQLCERYRVTVDANVHLHVLAQDLWHDSVGVDDIRRDWGAVWRRLLAATAPADTRLVELLAERLHAWRKEGSDDQREACWAELLVWCVRSNNSLVLVGLLQKYTAQFTAAVGALAFDQLLPPPTSESVEHVAALGVAGLAFPHNTWAETCVEQVVLSTLASSIPAQVLGNRLLHLGIVRHAFLPAFLSSAELLHAIGRTLLTPPPAEHSAAAEGYMLQGCGRLELLRRAVHVLMHVGLPALALEWTAVVLAAPAACVLPEHAGRWLAQLDCVVLGRQQVEHEKEVSVQQVEQEEEEDEEGAWGSEPDVELDLANDQDEELDGWGDDVDLDAHGEMEHGVAADVLLDNEEDAAWGDDDDIDLDAALNDL
ncbi:hypothetical protein IW150_006534 [Coemansia sp. RSA 2607]|nr:hypothetical protein IW150_006534 [Coemansia sp. RSA 2607]